MIKHFLNPPNWFTSASIFCSVFALTTLLNADEITRETLSRACILIVFGGVFDLLDGRVARLTNRFSEFGVQLDSIADIIGFGVAPALVAWTWKLHELGIVGALITFWYVLATAFRLARFNVSTQDDSDWELKGHSQGLTSTMAGGTLVTLIWVCNGYLYGVLKPPSWVVAGFVLALGGLMVSSIPFRNFKDIRRSRVTRRYLALGLACCLTGAIFLDISMWWGVGGALYLAIGLCDGLVVAWWHRKLSRALMFDEWEEFLEDGLGEVEESEELEV